jgi:WD40 repeat protein
MIRDLRLVLAYFRRAGVGGPSHSQSYSVLLYLRKQITHTLYFFYRVVGENINNLPLLKPKGTMTGHQGPIWTLAHDPKKGILYSGSSDKTIMVFHFFF